jgi:predicted N-acetyltransferase YhbS
VTDFAQATDLDATGIDALLDQSFGLSRRTKTSYRLREGNVAIPELSMVAREDGRIVATISYWPVVIGKDRRPALLLGPLAIHAKWQGQGLGLKLMRDTLQRAKQLGHRLVILVGDEPYYARVGFRVLPADLLTLPGPFDPKRFLYLELVEGSLKGVSGLVLPPQR